jgi:hypothetical protein
MIALAAVIVLRHADGTFIGSRPRQRVDDTVEAARCKRGELCRQHGSGRVGNVHEGVGIGKLHGLVGHDLRQLVAAIAHVHAPHAANAVEIFAAFRVGHMAALPLGDNQRPFLLEAFEMGPRMQEMVTVHLPQTFGIVLVMKRIMRRIEHGCPLGRIAGIYFDELLTD